MSYFKPLILLSFSTTLFFSACSEQPDSSKDISDSSASIESSASSSSEKSTESVAKPTVDRGASLYKRCRICHTLNKDGATKSGPNLYGIFGSQAGTRDGFRYSKAMSESEVIWTDENLAAYIKDPRGFMPKNAMSFAGLRNDADIALLLEYMREKTSE